MKKLFLALLGLAIVTSASAQEYDKNIFGIRVGINASKMTTYAERTDSKAGFQVAFSWQHLLSKKLPVYMETGLHLTQKGFRVVDFNSKGEKLDTYKLNPLYLEIPFTINYRFRLTDALSFYPSAGFYYALGIGGKEVYVSQKHPEDNEKNDLYNREENVGMKRSDFGVRIGATLDWKHLSFGAGYEFGLINVAKRKSTYDKMFNGNFFVSIGCNF